MTEAAVGVGLAATPQKSVTVVPVGRIGMWVFLAGETMLFGGLMGCYVLLGIAQGGWLTQGAHVSWQLGSLNTLVLFTSGMTAALTQNAAGARDLSRTKTYLGATVLLGLLFLGIEGIGYANDLRKGFGPLSSLFWSFYYLMTGLHTLHLLAGVLVNFALFIWVVRKGIETALDRRLEYAWLYWYFVSAVWIFLFALLYLSTKVA